MIETQQKTAPSTSAKVPAPGSDHLDEAAHAQTVAAPAPKTAAQTPAPPATPYQATEGQDAQSVAMGYQQKQREELKQRMASTRGHLGLGGRLLFSLAFAGYQGKVKHAHKLSNQYASAGLAVRRGEGDVKTFNNLGVKMVEATAATKMGRLQKHLTEVARERKDRADLVAGFKELPFHKYKDK